MTPISRFCVTALLFVLSLDASAQGDARRGLNLVQLGDGHGGAPCLTCHGIDGAGNEALMAPRLAGLDAAYLSKQLHDYQQGLRQGPLMLSSIAKLNEQQIADVAAYYSSQKAPAATTVNASAAQLALGERLAERGDWSAYIVPCTSCHGPGNLGVGGDFPALAGQYANYLQKQLHEWQNGNRRNDPNQLMLAIAGRMSDAQIEAVALYLASLAHQE